MRRSMLNKSTLTSLIHPDPAPESPRPGIIGRHKARAVSGFCSALLDNVISLPPAPCAPGAPPPERDEQETVSVNASAVETFIQRWQRAGGSERALTNRPRNVYAIDLTGLATCRTMGQGFSDNGPARRGWRWPKACSSARWHRRSVSQSCAKPRMWRLRR